MLFFPFRQHTVRRSRKQPRLEKGRSPRTPDKGVFREPECHLTCDTVPFLPLPFVTEKRMLLPIAKTTFDKWTWFFLHWGQKSRERKAAPRTDTPCGG